MADRLLSRWQKRVSATSARSSAAASAVRRHRLSNSGRPPRRFRSQDHAGAGSDALKGDWSGNVQAASQIRSEENATNAGNGAGTGVGSTFAAGNGEG